jgi:ZIP family zinc transporter
MSDFTLVLLIAALAAGFTYLGVPIAEHFDVPNLIVSGALQFAAGILTALVAFSLMPPAVGANIPVAIALAFFTGGAVFVAFEYYAARKMQERTSEGEETISIGLYVGILVDLIIDGAVIGLGASLSLFTGLLLALGIALSTAPLAFVSIATAKRQGMPIAQRRQLSLLFIACIMGGAVVSFLLLRNQSEAVRLTLIALASGFLITTITQSMIPEANRDGEPSFAGIMFVTGLTLYGVLTLLT